MITVSLDSPLPLEEQIYQELRRAVARGDVAPDEELPSVRQLGAELGVHWNTVARAYRRLRDDGLVSVGRGRGATVRGTQAAPRRPVAAIREGVRRKLEEALTEAQLGGLGADEIREIFRDVVRKKEAR